MLTACPARRSSYRRCCSSRPSSSAPSPRSATRATPRRCSSSSGSRGSCSACACRACCRTASCVLAAFLLLAPGVWYVVATTATLLLFVAYFLVILRAVRLPYPVSCSCFGRLGLGEVTRWTLARNGVLLALALVTWVDSWRGDGVARAAERPRRLGLGGSPALARRRRRRGVRRPRASGRTPPAEDADPTAYRPAPAPHGMLHGPDGPVPVRDLTDVAARLLVFGDPEQRSRPGGPGVVVGGPCSRPVRVHVVAERGTRSADASDDLVLLDPDGALPAAGWRAVLARAPCCSAPTGCSPADPSPGRTRSAAWSRPWRPSLGVAGPPA